MKFFSLFTFTQKSKSPHPLISTSLLLFFLLIILIGNFVSVASALTESELQGANCTREDSLNPNGGYAESASGIYIRKFYKCSPTVGYECGRIGLLGNECTKMSIGPNARMCGGDFTIANCLTTLADIIVGYLFKVVNWILSYVLTFASWFLDIVVYMTVVKFRSNFSDLNLNLNPTGNFLGDVSAGNALGVAGAGSENLIYYLWGILRDFLNIILLITIVYAAVQTMFQGFENQRNKFIYLLLFSIVMNFSLLLVKVAIDISNILSLQAYNLAVKPTGYDTWENFRKRQDNGGGKLTPSDMGEFIMNAFDIAELNKKKIQSDAAKERIEAGTKVSWVFEVGQFIVYGGLIYLIFFMIGMLVMRAAAFVLAMVLAAFLAADLFFEVVAKYHSGTEKNGSKEFIEQVRGVTDWIKNDFFDALVKGPILFLFIFLVGVLANAIFTQGVVAEIESITRSAGTSNEFGVLSGGAFVQSLGTFLKFLIFFALIQVVFKKLNELHLGHGGGKFFNKYAGKVAGQFLRAPAALLGGSYRAVAKRGFKEDGFASRAQKSLSGIVSDRSRSSLVRGLAASTNGLFERGKTATGDARNSKQLGRLGSILNKQFGLSVDAGTAETRGFEAIAKDKKKNANERRAKFDTNAALGAVPDEGDVVKMKSEKHFKTDSGVSLTLEELEDAIEKAGNNPSATTLSLKGGKVITTGDMSAFRPDDKGVVRANDALLVAKVDRNKQKEVLNTKAGEKFKAKLAENRAVGRGETYFAETVDKYSGREAITGRDTQGSIVKDAQTQGAEKRIGDTKAKDKLKGVQKQKVIAYTDILEDITLTINKLNESEKQYGKTTETTERIAELEKVKGEYAKYQSQLEFKDDILTDGGKKALDKLMGDNLLFENLVRSRDRAIGAVVDQVGKGEIYIDGILQRDASGKSLTKESSFQVANEEYARLQKRRPVEDRDALTAEVSAILSDPNLKDKSGKILPEASLRLAALKREELTMGEVVSKEELREAKKSLDKAQVDLKVYQKSLGQLSGSSSQNLRRDIGTHFGVKVEATAALGKPVDAAKSADAAKGH